MSDQFFYFYPHIFGHISSILVIKQALNNKFQSIIVTYNFCMIPHSLSFSFNLAQFGPKQNPTGLLEAIQRSDQNSKTPLIIKSTLERSFLMEKHQKNHFQKIALFTRFNLTMLQCYIAIWIITWLSTPASSRRWWACLCSLLTRCCWCTRWMTRRAGTRWPGSGTPSSDTRGTRWGAQCIRWLYWL